jgi:hypothetical protein
VKPTLHTLYWWLLGLVLAGLLYVLSSGPVIAAAFWLREATGWDGWYAIAFLYYPLLAAGAHDNPIDWYVGFWVWLFGTVGPG